MEKTILIVEDNPLNMRLFCDLLTAHGYRPIACDDGHSAVARAEDNRPDLIIMDIHLNGISGIDVTRKILAKPELAHVPIIAVTAFVMESEEYMVNEVGFAAYLTKPIQMRPFIDTIARFLSQARPYADLRVPSEDAA